MYIQEEIAKIKPEMVICKVMEAGWQEVDTKRTDIRLFRKGDVILTVPILQSAVEYQRRMQEALERLAKVENCLLREIIGEFKAEGGNDENL